MTICPSCQSQILSSDAVKCAVCGAQLIANTNEPVNSDTDDLGFKVTETSSSGPEFVGGQTKFDSDASDRNDPKENDLGIESAAELMDREARETNHSTLPDNEQLTSTVRTPIGQSEPPLPPTPDYSASDDQSKTPVDSSILKDEKPAEVVKKLSTEEIRKIEQNLYSKSPDYLGDQEKNDLKSKLRSFDKPRNNANPANRNTIVNADTKLLKPKMAPKGRGVAYYYKNYLQFTGHHRFLPNDEITISGNNYELRPKKFDTKWGIASAVMLFALVLFAVGSGFISNQNGFGHIAGVVLDRNDKPYINGAIIRLTELDRAYQTNAIGMFKTEPLPEGSHRLEYIIDGNIVKVDYATVVGDEITTITLKSDNAQSRRPKISSTTNATRQTAATNQQATAQTAPTNKAVTNSSPSTKPKQPAKSTSRKSLKSGYGKVVLAANVAGARLKIDGSVVGAGNITYSKIKSGKHSYSVSKAGYKTRSGSFSLKAGEKKQLNITLSSRQTAKSTNSSSAENFYSSGYNLLKGNEYDKAVEDLSAAIELKPSYAEAYYYRAESNIQLDRTSQAISDYIKAAEIYQFKGQSGRAITSYNKAIKLDKKSIGALLGRAGTYLRKGEERAAIADYESVTNIDKRNAQGYIGLGEARFQQGNYKKAIKHFKDARSLQADNPLIYQYLMLSYLGQNDEKNVKKSFDKFVNVATEKQMANLVGDKKYAGVLKIIDKD